MGLHFLTVPICLKTLNQYHVCLTGGFWGNVLEITIRMARFLNFFTQKADEINGNKSLKESQSLRKCDLCYMSLVVRKPVFGVSDQVRHKPGCTATEDG